ncbi:MAG TPA: methyltransferase dimerization domain-containing protein, partial [Myxococcales bacterium]|nr:methyltransferase dimerization domain-containing protein [Myxococcales bacterium]
MSDAKMSPEGILQLGLGFWASKTLLSAVELGVFTALAGAPQDLDSLRTQLGLHPRSASD